ncbi:MAG: hypothetical protein IJA44_03240 [Clostridia bacterium]|nr:hypothetical protein [Clostridia bacterium]
MEGSRTEKIFFIAMIMKKYNYVINETISKRINNYEFQTNTTITHDEKQIKISTETKIKGVYYVLILFPNGTSKVDFEFD